MEQHTKPKPLFNLGQVCATPGAIERAGWELIASCLIRHRRSDWGVICDDDKALNDEAVEAGDRILSSYRIDPLTPDEGRGDNTLWIITEADRSVTTALLPSEY